MLILVYLTETIFNPYWPGALSKIPVARTEGLQDINCVSRKDNLWYTSTGKKCLPSWFSWSGNHLKLLTCHSWCHNWSPGILMTSYLTKNLMSQKGQKRPFSLLWIFSFMEKAHLWIFSPKRVNDYWPTADWHLPNFPRSLDILEVTCCSLL